MGGVPELHAGIADELWIEEGPRAYDSPRVTFLMGVQAANGWFLRNIQAPSSEYTKEDLAKELRLDGVIFDTAGLQHEFDRRKASRIPAIKTGEVVASREALEAENALRIEG